MSHTHTHTARVLQKRPEQSRNVEMSGIPQIQGITHDGSDRTNCHPWTWSPAAAGFNHVTRLPSKHVPGLTVQDSSVHAVLKKSIFHQNIITCSTSETTFLLTWPWQVEKNYIIAENAIETECTIIEHHNNKLHFKIEKKKVILNVPVAQW